MTKGYWLGKKRTMESRKKQGQGLKQWWAENKDSEQVKQRNLKLTKRIFKHTDEAKDKISKAHIGIKHSPETKLKMSLARKGYKYSKEHNEKISRALTGRIFSDETKQKMRVAKEKLWTPERKTWWSNIRSGKNNPGWIDGRSSLPYDFDFNKPFKQYIRTRDKCTCQLCGASEEELNNSLHIHHIDYNKHNSINENCISLCVSCHSLTQTNRDNWKTFLQKLLAEKYNYKYTADGNIIIELKGGTTNGK